MTADSDSASEGSTPPGTFLLTLAFFLFLAVRAEVLVGSEYTQIAAVSLCSKEQTILGCLTKMFQLHHTVLVHERNVRQRTT